MGKFNRCVNRKKLDAGGYEIECKFGLWSVQASTKSEAEQEARYYFEQYKLDGEYHTILGGKSPVDITTI